MRLNFIYGRQNKKDEAVPRPTDFINGKIYEYGWKAVSLRWLMSTTCDSMPYSSLLT